MFSLGLSAPASRVRSRLIAALAAVGIALGGGIAVADLPAFADEPDFGTFDSGEGWHVTYGSDGAHASNDGSTLTLTGGHTYTVTREPGASNDCRINFTGEGNVTVNLAGVDCGGNGSDGPGLDADRGGTTTLHLVANTTNTFQGRGFVAGVRKGTAGSLVIEADDASGKLIARARNWGAGIGGDDSQSASGITIKGGTITATGEYAGAGIGGGGHGSRGGAGSDITILGGNITATSEYGAGIGGGGERGSGSNITIKGGNIAASSYNGAGIGGANEGTGSNIVISGGTVAATSNRGDGIGAGQDGAWASGPVTGVVISGGSVKASRIGVQPTDKLENGTNVYLAEVPLTGRVDAIIVDSATTLTRAGSHPDGDSVFYAYLPGGSNHVIKAGEDTFQVTWKEESHSFDVVDTAASYGWRVTGGELGTDWKTTIDGTLTLKGGKSYRVWRVPKTSKNCRINFEGDGTTTVTLAGVDCSGNNKEGAPGLDAGRHTSDTTLILEGEHNIFQGGPSAAGVYKDGREGDTGTLRITAPTTNDVLYAFGGTDSAGIGGSYYRASEGYVHTSHIVISGGTVLANGPEDGGQSIASGLGGSFRGNASDITIEGGVLAALGNDLGAGIGATNGKRASDIRITGGTLDIFSRGGNSETIGAPEGTLDNLIIDGGSVRLWCNSQPNCPKPLQITPKNSAGEEVFLAKIPIPADAADLNSIIVDPGTSDQRTFKRDGVHEINGEVDTTFYAYLPGTEHIVKVGDMSYRALR